MRLRFFDRGFVSWSIGPLGSYAASEHPKLAELVNKSTSYSFSVADVQ